MRHRRWKFGLKCLLLTTGMFFFLTGGNSLLAAGSVTVRTAFNQTGNIGFVRLRDGDTLWVVVSNAPAACYEFNLKRLAVSPPARSLTAPLPPLETVHIEFTHDGESTTYQIVASPFNNPSFDCSAYKESRTWEVLVETPGWRIGFAAAFTMDTLTSDRFFLEQITGDEGSSGSGDMPVFSIRRTTQGADDLKLGTAAMIHLFHSDPKKLGGWAPVSFGLGTGSDSNLRYYVGTSFRFSDKLYLTGGTALGSVDELPPQFLTESGNRTTDSNILSSLQRRTKAGFFFSLSYNFGNVGADFFKGKFGSKSPDPKSVSRSN